MAWHRRDPRLLQPRSCVELDCIAPWLRLSSATTVRKEKPHLPPKAWHDALMHSSSDQDRKLAERTASVGFADTLANFSPRATISPLAMAEAGVPVPAAIVDRILEPSATGDLPIIAVDVSQADEASSLSRGTSDLKVVRVLGEGGMGRVLLAHQRSLGREIAIKTLKAGDNSPMLVGGLLREARLTGSIEHPGVVPVHALGLDESGRPVLVMKRIEGESFLKMLEDSNHSIWQAFLSDGADRLEACLHIVMRVCESLAFAHSRGLLHRDIKPENVMVGAYGEVYLCDWGIAKRVNEPETFEGMIIGTPGYMAPEMLLGDPMDARTDVYLLGAMLHHVLTGKPRHEGSPMFQILKSVVASAPYAYEVDVPAELGELCNRATSADPAARPTSADAFRKELAAFLRRRSALGLCNAAQERLTALEKALDAAPSNTVPDDLNMVYRHGNEARFGFVQSLRVDPTLTVAKEGLERTLAAVVDLDLRQHHIESAAALLNEMVRAPEALTARLANARKEVEKQRQEAERFRALERDLDPSIGSRQRNIAFGLVLLAVLGVTGISESGENLEKLTVADSVGFAAFVLGACGVAFAVFRRRLLATSYNRRLAGAVFLVGVFLLINRLFGWAIGESPRSLIASDVVVMCGIVSVASVTFDKRLAFGALWLGCVRIAMHVAPAHSNRFFTVAMLGLSAVLLWISRTPRAQTIEMT